MRSTVAVTTRSISEVTRELNELRNRRELNGGSESAGDRWSRQMLEAEERRAREKEKIAI